MLIYGVRVGNFGKVGVGYFTSDSAALVPLKIMFIIFYKAFIALSSCNSWSCRVTENHSTLSC